MAKTSRKRDRRPTIVTMPRDQLVHLVTEIVTECVHHGTAELKRDVQALGEEVFGRRKREALEARRDDAPPVVRAMAEDPELIGHVRRYTGQAFEASEELAGIADALHEHLNRVLGESDGGAGPGNGAGVGRDEPRPGGQVGDLHMALERIRMEINRTRLALSRLRGV